MKREKAAELARDALIFLAERPEEIARLLAESGAEAGQLRQRAQDEDFLGFVMDFVMAAEDRARAFCESANLSPERLAAARAALPGGDSPHWT